MATTIINFTATNTSNFLSSAINIINDLKPILIPVLAILLGFFIIDALVSMFFKKKEEE